MAEKKQAAKKGGQKTTKAGKKFGRPTKLTPDTVEAICKAIRGGSYFGVACEYAGISDSTGHAWLAIAKGENPERKPTKHFLDFLESVKKAQADAEVAAIARIQKAARGGDLVKRTVKTTTRKNGEVTEEVVEEFTAPQWQADAWTQERMHPDRWGRRVRNELTGANGEPIKTENTGGPAIVAVVLPDNGRGDGPAGVLQSALPVILRDEDATALGIDQGLPDNGRGDADHGEP